MTLRIPHTGRRAFALLAACALATPAAANNLGENGAWQFRTTADLANLAAVLDVMQKKQSGAYATPTTITNTTIEHQYNCGVSASAVGNSGSQTALANSATVTGASATSAGSSSTTGLGATSSTSQSNSGTVSSGITGGTSAAVQGTATQALNSTQTNSGTQLASATGSTGCAFGALN